MTQRSAHRKPLKPPIVCFKSSTYPRPSKMTYHCRATCLPATNGWYFIVTMGRSSGHLALGLAKAAGATLALIPEEFDPEAFTLDRVCEVLEGSILKRKAGAGKEGWPS